PLAPRGRGPSLRSARPACPPSPRPSTPPLLALAPGCGTVSRPCHAPDRRSPEQEETFGQRGGTVGRPCHNRALRTRSAAMGEDAELLTPVRAPICGVARNPAVPGACAIVAASPRAGLKGFGYLVSLGVPAVPQAAGRRSRGK